MTFRPSPRRRLIYPVTIFGLIVFMYLALRYMRSMEMAGALGTILVAGSIFLVTTAIGSLHVWRSRVVVDELGVHWKGGPWGSGSLDWARIKSVTYDDVSPGALVDISGYRHPLPFLSNDLMRRIDEQLAACRR
jgi:hypothetical protein